MHRRTGIRLTIAAGLAVGLSFAFASQYASGADHDAGSGSGTAASLSTERAAVVTSDVWPTDLQPAHGPSSSAPATDAESPALPSDQEAVPSDDRSPDDLPSDAVAPVSASTAVPAPVEPVADVTRGGTVHVDVTQVDGATRSVSLQTAGGTPVGGPVAVDGSRITFADVADGSYDLFVEETADGGGTFLTRTPLVVSGGELVVSCDADTVDCTVT